MIKLFAITLFLVFGCISERSFSTENCRLVYGDLIQYLEYLKSKENDRREFVEYGYKNMVVIELALVNLVKCSSGDEKIIDKFLVLDILTGIVNIKEYLIVSSPKIKKNNFCDELKECVQEKKKFNLIVGESIKLPILLGFYLKRMDENR